jgi:alpha-glucosidase (family GH31 glycosyl hydrolase)
MPNYGSVTFGVNSTVWEAVNETQYDYFVTTWPASATGSQQAAAIMNNYVDAVGHVPQLPAYAAGFLARARSLSLKKRKNVQD